jgi:Cu/Ag efflux pump CusA
VVWGSPTIRHDVTGVKQLVIDTPSGGHVRLGQVADVRLAPYPVVIKHQGISRTLDVTADVSGRSLGAVTQDVTDRVQAMTFPLEYHAEVVGGNAALQSSDRRMLGFGLAALIGIYLLFQAATGSWRVATLLMVTIPLAAVGGLVAGYLAGGIMSVGALLGLLLVLALATRQGLVLVDRYTHLARESEADGPARVLRGTRDRLVPVLLTTLTVAAALLPFALTGDIPGTEIMHPVAVVALGGLVTATVVTLMVIPSLYLRFATGKEVSDENA